MHFANFCGDIIVKEERVGVCIAFVLLQCITYVCVSFSLLREHSIDGTGWAPTRTLKVVLYKTFAWSRLEKNLKECDIFSSVFGALSCQS